MDRKDRNGSFEMRVREQPLVDSLYDGLAMLEAGPFPLPGIQNLMRRDAYVMQLVDSIRRVRYVSVIAGREIHPDRANGVSTMFDPLRAAILRRRDGQFEEACWLVFLFVHFGKHARSGYRYAREIYAALGTRAPWTFANVCADVAGFRGWLDAHEGEISRGSARGFGNHRKYESLAAFGPNGTGEAVATYVQWVLGHESHEALFAGALARANGDAFIAFDDLYRSMAIVRRFGRTARFDYLTMVSKLGLAAIHPGSAYFSNSTGPVVGARLMLQGNINHDLTNAELDRRVGLMAHNLGVGMQEMEDSLCNWQKTPDHYTRSRA